MNANKLDGKIAVITDATSGLGLATAKRFVAEGAYVSSASRKNLIFRFSATRRPAQV
jgi:NAD(P)-dependent dehydrogenase (short-subunit alcohol dehydrogenase family)